MPSTIASSLVADLRDGGSAESMAAILREAPADEVGPCVEGLAAAVLAELRADSGRALQWADHLVEVARFSGQRKAMARASWVRGHALSELLRHDEAQRAYRKAMRIYREEGCSYEAARVCLGQINVLRKIGRDPQALRLGEEARQELLRHRDHLAVVRLDVNLAAILQHHERRAEALRVYDRALRLARRSGNRPIEQILEYNRATVLGHLGRLEQARRIYHRLREEIDCSREARLSGVIYYGLGCVARQAGDYELAHRHLFAARDRFEGIDAPEDLLQTGLELASLLLGVGSARRAERLAQEAVASARRHSMQKEEARGVLLLGTSMLSMGRLDEAEDTLSQAQQLLDVAGLVVSGAGCAMQLAEVATRRGERSRARGYLSRAEAVLQREGVRPLRIEVLLRRARLEVEASDLEACEAMLRSARRLMRTVPAGDRAADVAHLAGRRAEGAGQLGVAVREYRRAVSRLERTRDRIDTDELRLSHAADHREIFDDLIRLLVARGSKAALEEAYVLIDRARTRQWVERVGSRLSPRRLARSPRTLRLGARIEDLRSSLRGLHGAHRDPDSLPRPVRGWKALRQDILDREAELADLHQRLDRAESREGLPRSGTPLTVEETCRRLPRGVALVAYHVTENSSFGFVLRRQGLRTVDLGVGRSTLRRELSRLRFHLEKWNYGEGYVDAHRERLEEELDHRLESLGKGLWRPLHIEEEEVWVVPHGPLHNLPFELLPVEGKHRLFDRHRLLRLSSGGSRQGRSICLVPTSLRSAWPRDGHGRVGGRSVVVGVDHPELADLGRELRGVRRALGASTSLRNRRATRTRFAEECASADLVHIATHGVYRADDPFFSALELGDGWLTLYDVYRLQLRARLVTLSACPVAGVAAEQEHGGLARGLFRAGARALLMSQWSVDDRTTAHFMGLFYRGLGRGQSPAQALRSAKAQVRDQRPDPYYWAPFVLYGSCEG